MRVEQSSRWLGVALLLAILLPSGSLLADSAFRVGDEILFMERDLGIPIHRTGPSAGGYVRVPGGSRATVLELGPEGKRHWLRVRSGNVDGWVGSQYVAEVLGAELGDPVSTQPGTSAATTPDGAPLTYTIGTWNLEHFSVKGTRGFPERRGSRAYPPRTEDDLRKIATIITERLGAQFLSLNEIDGTEAQQEGETVQASEKLDELLALLPETWTYEIAKSGDDIRVAFFWDRAKVRLDEIVEITVPRQLVEDRKTPGAQPSPKDIFDRDPLVAKITLLAPSPSGGTQSLAMNDLVVVGVHLASEQWRSNNHDTAMNLLRQNLVALQQAGQLGGLDEHDILIMGDMNANAFTPPVEQFFLEMDASNSPWDVLVDDDYPPTRLSGTPLRLRTSQIDYIIASRFGGQRHGLSGDEVTETSAKVHVEIVDDEGGPDEYRKSISDHLPVTVKVRVVPDSDRQPE